MTMDTWERLLRNSCRDVNTNCLNWIGFSKNGYGSTSFKGKNISSHRLSYMIWKNQCNPIELKNENGVRMFVRHMCNNSFCIEPSHLKLGTQYENDYDDKILHGTLQRGIKHYNCSISEDKARRIKWSFFEKNHPSYMTRKERSILFEVPISLIRCIDRGKSWSHIPDRYGNTTSHRKENARKMRKLARDKIWTKSEFDNAMSKIKEFSEEFDGGYIDLCWKWLKGVNSDGYGRMTISGKDSRVHIFSCEAKYGRHRRQDEVTRHLCSNKICCNPDHLEFGTPTENSRDTLLDGSNKRLKLDRNKVENIRDSIESLEKLSDMYGVSETTIYRVKKRKTWNI